MVQLSFLAAPKTQRSSIKEVRPLYARTCACWCGWTTEHTSGKKKLVENKKDRTRRRTQRGRWVKEGRKTLMVTRGDATAMNLLLNPPGCCWLVRSETPKNGNTWTDALRQISSHSCPNMLKLVPSQWWCHYHQPECEEDVATLSKIFVLYLQLKLKAQSGGFVTPSGDTAYCTQCWVITIFWRPAGFSQ